MNPIIRRKIRAAIQAELNIQSAAYQSRTEHSMIEDMLDEIEKILDAERVPMSDVVQDGNFINVDALGADRKAREVPIPDFNPLGGGLRGVGRCTCPAGRGTNPACPVHP